MEESQQDIGIFREILTVTNITIELIFQDRALKIVDNFSIK